MTSNPQARQHLQRQNTTDLESDYFSSNPPPAALPRHKTLARTFIDQHVSSRRRVVLITSGGTTVPLEHNTVRFIDNFSAGTRGATSAEYFLEAGYAVIFLHRQFSLLPYSRHYSHSTNCFLDFLHEGDEGNVVANEEYRAAMLEVLRKYKAAKRNNLLLLLPFTTISEYLFELREIAMLMRPLGRSGLFYLAAAVSDFFVPKERMAEHKIQSLEIPTNSSISKATSVPASASEEKEKTEKEEAPTQVQSKKLIVDLDPVPKFLKRLVDGWAPESMIVSFKLETDPQILVSKAHYALNRYAHHLVIGNLLSTRKWEVVFVSPYRPDYWIRVPRHRRTKSLSGIANLVGLAALRSGDIDNDIDGEGRRKWEGNEISDEMEREREKELNVSQDEPVLEIESLIVPEVAKMHGDMIEGIS
jgi:phosphopantothenate-cysteine ligase